MSSVPPKTLKLAAFTLSNEKLGSTHEDKSGYFGLPCDRRLTL